MWSHITATLRPAFGENMNWITFHLLSPQEKEEQTSLNIINDRIYQEDKCKEQEVQLIRKFEMEVFFPRDFFNRKRC